MPVSLFRRTRPMPTRAEVLELYAQGLSTREVADRLQITDSWARRVKQEHRESGVVKNAVARRRTPLWKAVEERLRKLIEETPDLTLAELKAALDTKLSVSTLCRALARMDLTLKKKRWSPVNASVRTSSSGVGNGVNGGRRSRRRGWFSSTKPASKPT